MQIQPISLLNQYNKKNVNLHKTQPSKTAFSGVTTNYPEKDQRMVNALKALSLASAIAFTPGMISCSKTELEDCDHPNHIDPPYPNDSTAVDTIYTGKTYELPEFSMRRYKVEDNDTTFFGNVTFSPAIVHVPYNAHETSELKTVMKFINAMGLKTKTADKEYVATKSFEYNLIPAQLTWLNEKNGSVTQLKYNGFNSEDNLVKMDLISIPSKGNPIEQQLQLTSAGVDKLLIGIFDKSGKEKLSETLLTMDNDTIRQFNIKENGHFSKVCEYSKLNNGSSIKAKDLNGNEYKLANFDVITAISEEKE